MDLATTLALILLIGAVILAVVSVLAYLLYRHSLRQATLRSGPAPAPSLDVPVPPPPPSASTDGAPTELPPEPAEAPGESAPAPPSGLSFLEYDGEAFVPVRLASCPPADEPAHDVPTIIHRTNGFAWR